MSCTYADGLSPYEDKGVLGVPEKFDEEDKVESKCLLLADWIKEARHVVFHTGAGISTTAGIPDFRGPNGVWTLEKKGLKPNINISFDDAVPTKTHMALKKLIDVGLVKYIVSQNIDGLHLRSGIKREFLSELHGNMFIEQCDNCEKQFIRDCATTSVGEKSLNKNCPRQRLNGRACRGKICDTILDWEANLPENDLKLAELHSSVADLNICLGTTLQIVPSGNLPINCKKFGGKLVIINLQPTKHDKKSDLIINCYVDTVMEKIMKRLGLEIPEYSPEADPSKDEEIKTKGKLIEWTIFSRDMNNIKQLYDEHCKNFKKRKLEQKRGGKKLKKEKVNIKEVKDVKKEIEVKEEAQKEIDVKDEVQKDVDLKDEVQKDVDLKDEVQTDAELKDAVQKEIDVKDVQKEEVRKEIDAKENNEKKDDEMEVTEEKSVEENGNEEIKDVENNEDK